MNRITLFATAASLALSVALPSWAQGTAPPPPSDKLNSARTELVQAWDAGWAAEQRKTNAVSGMMNAVNVAMTGLQAQVTALTGERDKDAAALKASAAQHAGDLAALKSAQAQVALLQNQLAAEKAAAKLHPPAAALAHPGGVMTDRGRPLMMDLPLGYKPIDAGHLPPRGPQSVPAKR